MEMHDDEKATLWVGAFRYYLGRQTYAVQSFCELLIKNWNDIPERTRELIKRELGRSFERDDEQRISGTRGLVRELGWDCDRAAWCSVKDLYSKGYMNPIGSIPKDGE